MSEIVVFLKEWLPTAAVGIVPVYLFLKQDIRHAKESAAKDFGSIEKLLDRDRASLNEKFGSIEKQFGRIDKQLSNHVTGTENKIKELKKELKGDVKELKGDVKELKEDMKEGQDKLAEGQAELYKLLSSKSPDKKQ